MPHFLCKQKSINLTLTIKSKMCCYASLISIIIYYHLWKKIKISHIIYGVDLDCSLVTISLIIIYQQWNDINIRPNSTFHSLTCYPQKISPPSTTQLLILHIIFPNVGPHIHSSPPSNQIQRLQISTKGPHITWLYTLGAKTTGPTRWNINGWDQLPPSTIKHA